MFHVRSIHEGRRERKEDSGKGGERRIALDDLIPRAKDRGTCVPCLFGALTGDVTSCSSRSSHCPARVDVEMRALQRLLQTTEIPRSRRLDRAPRYWVSARSSTTIAPMSVAQPPLAKRWSSSCRMRAGPCLRSTQLMPEEVPCSLPIQLMTSLYSQVGRVGTTSLVIVIIPDRMHDIQPRAPSRTVAGFYFQRTGTCLSRTVGIDALDGRLDGSRDQESDGG